jgi:hypothetical protein
MEYYSQEKPNKYPKCGSSMVVKIVYGEPSYGGSLEAESGMIILGGCTITDYDPEWTCLHCKVQIFKSEVSP